jgi:hypothetical protein
MNWLIINTALGLALTCFYLCLDHCGRIFSKKVFDREKPQVSLICLSFILRKYIEMLIPLIFWKRFQHHGESGKS